MHCCKDDSGRASAVFRAPFPRPCFSSNRRFSTGRSGPKDHGEGVRFPAESRNQNPIFLAGSLPVPRREYSTLQRKKPFVSRSKSGRIFSRRSFVFCVAVGLGVRKDPGRSFFLRPDRAMRNRCVRNASEIRDSFIIPGRVEVFCDSSAGLGISGITDFILIGDHHPAGFPDSFFGLFGYDLRDALVALAVVIGADIEEVVVLPVIPAYHLSFLSVIFPAGMDVSSVFFFRSSAARSQLRDRMAWAFRNSIGAAAFISEEITLVR